MTGLELKPVTNPSFAAAMPRAANLAMHAYPNKRIGAQAMIGAGCKPNCCTQPRAAPWGNDVALIKVSRSVRATCFMRGNAPCGVNVVNVVTRFRRVAFLRRRKNAKCINRGLRPPQDVALGYWLQLGLQPAPTI